jgi:hypothetical protein
LRKIPFSFWKEWAGFESKIGVVDVVVPELDTLLPLHPSGHKNRMNMAATSNSTLRGTVRNLFVRIQNSIVPMRDSRSPIDTVWYFVI